HGPLRRHVVKEQGGALGHDGRGDVDDAPAALTAHHRNDGPSTVPDALDVDRHDAIPLRLRDLVERLRLQRGEHRGVVDEHVDAAETRDRKSTRLNSTWPSRMPSSA